MKNKDFKIGNIIKTPKDESGLLNCEDFSFITSLSKDILHYKANTSIEGVTKNSGIKYEEAEGYPLSEDILLRLGFKKLPHTNQFTLWDEEYILLVLEDDDWNDISFDVYKGGRYLTVVSFVHEIQNLMYSIGDELEFKL